MRIMNDIDRSVQRYAGRHDTLTKRRLKLIAAFGAVSATLLAFGGTSQEVTADMSAVSEQDADHLISSFGDCLILGAETVVATGEADTNGIGSVIVTHTEGVNWRTECYDEALEWVYQQNGEDASNFRNTPGETIVVPEQVIRNEQS